MPRYWVVAPVESKPVERFEKVWQFDLANNLISIGWDALGDVSKMDREALCGAVAAAYPDKPLATKGLIVNMLWFFWHEIRPGDLVIARRGRTILAAVGRVVRGAFYAPGKNPLLAGSGYSHHGFLGVEWQQQPRDKNFHEIVFPMFTLKEISEVDYRRFAGVDSIADGGPPTLDAAGTVAGSSAFALEKHLEDFIVSNFEAIFKGELRMYEDEAGAEGQQYETDIGTIDILAFEPKSNSFVVIELKRDSSSDQVVGQILRYMGWVKKELCKEGQGVKGLVICHDSDRKMSYALGMVSNVAVRYYEVEFKLGEAPKSFAP
jgi:restriction system protein